MKKQLVLFLGLFCVGAQAARIVSLSPQNEVAEVRQVQVRFDEAMVRFGDPKSPAPLAVQCEDAAASRGEARWVDDKNWVFDFANDLPAGLKCKLKVAGGLKSVAGTSYAGPSQYNFNTGGPFVRNIWPRSSQIDEDQAFIVELNSPATEESFRQNVWCQARGIGEQIPIRLITGKDRDALLNRVSLKKASERAYAFSCQQRLPASADVQVIYGRGVSTPSGLANKIQKSFAFTVREPFKAEFSCERENAHGACVPLRPLLLNFTAPVSRKDAQAIVLQTPDGKLKPELDKDDAPVSSVSFAAPLPENAEITVVLPKNLQDESGRALVNADRFPLKTKTAAMPPLAKFAAAPFGIVERFAEKNMPPLLPVTLRNVETDLAVKGIKAERPGRAADLKLASDEEIIRWYKLVNLLDERSYTRSELDAILAGRTHRTNYSERRNQTEIETRTVSLLNHQKQAKALQLPKAETGKPRPFEVVGIPLAEPGFHVVEIESPALGRALLDRNAPMYVRTAALVTNLSVHFKTSRENALVWVTSLDKGRPVANARIQVSDCNGKVLARGLTDKQGLLPIAMPIRGEHDCEGMSGYFVSARATDEHGVEDMGFVLSSWDRGIESWRFNVPTNTSQKPTVRMHTVLDRPLLRAGETVGMKHFIRKETSKGLALPDYYPDRVVIEHQGSGQQFTLPLSWRKTATGGMSSESRFTIPEAAKLGVYEVRLPSRSEDEYGASSAYFRVEEFRLPVLEGKIAVSGGSKAVPLVNTTEAPLDVQINYVSGGAAGGLPVRVSALLRPKFLSFKDYGTFSFQAWDDQTEARSHDDEEGESEASESGEQKLVADKLPMTLDKNGAGRLKLSTLPKVKKPTELLLEAGFSDPNGEVQTIRSLTMLWPAGVIAGIKADSWVSVKNKLPLQALALDLAGKPQAGIALEVRAIARITTTSRKRMVGGFYSYDSKTETRDLGKICSGKSDERGLLLCDAKLEEAGNIELVVTARDKSGNAVTATTSVWATKQGDVWFGGENNDRIDVLPEKTLYKSGETARFQVRMPYRRATALVSIEREGILESQLFELTGDDPTVSLKIKPEWGPNVFVSVLVQRGRVYEVPWYSFFTWGWRQPGNWWRAWRDSANEYQAPTAMVDLAKPSFKLGLAQIRVDSPQHRLEVSVKSDKESYAIRGKARVTVQVKLPDGSPAAYGEVALAVVDQALLELMPNASWDVLGNLLKQREYGVETATAQMEIIGRRHFGKKAVPAGGGGGNSPTRELLETLLLWSPAVKLDAHGAAQIDVPLNDAITSFKIVAVADYGVARFGTGDKTIRVTQDLQLISGLPPLIREDDQFRAQITLRNTTNRAMKVEVKARAPLPDLKPQQVEIPAGEAREVAWNVVVPASLGQKLDDQLVWELEAREIGGAGVTDKLKISQKLVPAVPVTVQQATLIRLDGNVKLPVNQPADSLPGRGGLHLALQPKLADGLPAVHDWFVRYPFACLEQKTSKAVGLRDQNLWKTVVNQMPAYLDADGLASYFPPRSGDDHAGSDTLTAYLLSATDEAGKLGLDFTIPDELRARLEEGLINFVEGRIKRDFWSPQKDLDVRKLAALEALSRFGKVQPKYLGSLTIAPNQWPTSAVIDWYAVLLRTSNLPQRDVRLKEAEQILRSRLTFQGTRMGFSTEKDDYWWWLMVNGDVNAAKLIALVIELPQWQDDVPRLLTGMLGRQRNGAWVTTTANLWGGLALERFSQHFEREPVTGVTRAELEVAKQQAAIDWSRVSKLAPAEGQGPAVVGTNATLKNNSALLAWPAKPTPDQLLINHQGSGKPWLTLQSLAAVPLKQAFASGYRIKKTIAAVEQANKGRYTRGDVLKVTLEVDAQADMSWVVISDPIPAGSTILGSGLGRDSEIVTQGERDSGDGWLAFEEKGFEHFRAYYAYLPKGSLKVEYTVRLNNAGEFNQPPTRVEAMYAPEVFGETPNGKMKVELK